MVKTQPFKWKGFGFDPWWENSDPMWHVAKKKTKKILLTYSPPSLTGLYDTPTLSVEPRSEVTSGENVTFHCQLATATSTFFLLKKGRSSRPQLRYGNLRAEFHLGPVTPAHGGTYRCFGSYNNHAWSFPSKPVKLLVKGEDLPPNFAPCPFWISK